MDPWRSRFARWTVSVKEMVAKEESYDGANDENGVGFKIATIAQKPSQFS